MTPLERLVRKAGGKLVRINRHLIYELNGERIVIHCGTKVCSRQEKSIKSQLRRLKKEQQ